jgi:hypothetical protein
MLPKIIGIVLATGLSKRRTGSELLSRPGVQPGLRLKMRE